MIFADKLIENRKKNGWSQEDLAYKLGVSRQSVSKWESAQAIPDMKKILQMADLFQVSTDYLLRDEIEDTGNDSVPVEVDNDDPVRRVSLEEANAFLQHNQKAASLVSTGVMLCILSPIVLILLGGGQEAGLLALTENQAAGIGVLILMLMVGAAVGLFVFYGMKLKPYEYISKEPIETAYGVHGMVAERLQNYQKAHTRYMVIGILLCVLSCIPIFLALILNPDNDMIGVLAVSVLLVMIGIGVLLIVRTSIIMEGLQALLEEGEFSRDNKNESRRNETVMGIYWMSATAIYLAASFLTKRWDITWVIWPVAGVCCGILAAVLKVVRSKE